MFSTSRIASLLRRLEESTLQGELWVQNPATGPRLDFFSAMEPEARALFDQGFGPGGDPVWMGTMLDQGWPEWLVMLLLSLTYASVGAGADALDALPEGVRAGFMGSEEDAEAFAFVHACVGALDTPAPSTLLRRRYSVARLGEGDFSALDCIRGGVRTGHATSEGLELFEAMAQELGSTDGMLREETRAWRSRLSDLDTGAVPAELRDYASAVLSIDDYTPLYALTWPMKGDEMPWAPSSHELYRACRASLRGVLQAAR